MHGYFGVSRSLFVISHWSIVINELLLDFRHVNLNWRDLVFFILVIY